MVHRIGRRRDRIPSGRGESLSSALGAYAEARTGAIRAARKLLGIGELDARAMLFIVEHPGARPGELGEHLDITAASVTTLTDRLIERGALQRRHDALDERAFRLHPTVDLERRPWSALTGFDHAVLGAIEADEPEAIERTAVLIRRITEAGVH